MAAAVGLRLHRRGVVAPLVALGSVAGAAVIGLAIGAGRPAVLALVALPLIVGIALSLIGPARWLLVPAVLAVGFIGIPVTNKLQLGPLGLYVTDMIVGGAIAGFVTQWLLSPSGRRPRLPRTAVVGLPLLVFTVALMIAAFRGHARYDATLIGNPLRLAAYSMIIFALSGVTPKRALDGITAVMYAGAFLLAIIAVYHIGTGTSATEFSDLSTGGIRYIGTTAAAFASSSFLLAVFHLAAKRAYPLWHLTVALVAGFDVIVAYTRTMWLAVTILLIGAMIIGTPVRRALLQSIPIVLPLLLLGVLLVLRFTPDLATTMIDRISTPAGQDTSVSWRETAYRTVLAGTDDEQLLGVGFGRVTSFSINDMPNVIEGDPHNGYIYVYSGAGIVGVIALAFLMLTYVWDTVTRWYTALGQDRTLIAWCFATWLLFMFHAASEPVFTSPPRVLLIWVCMTLPAVVARPPRTAPRAVPVPQRRPRAQRPAALAR